MSQYFQGLELGDDDIEEEVQEKHERISVRSVALSSIHKVMTFMDIMRIASVTDIASQTGAYDLSIRMKHSDTLMYRLSPWLSAKITTVKSCLYLVNELDNSCSCLKKVL